MKLIGITPYTTDNDKQYKLNKQYCDAVENAGAVPVILNYGKISEIERMLSILDGVLLTGGDDVDPYYFGKPPIVGLGEISPLRDKYEIELCKTAFQMDKKILGICRGIQVMNIALGGEIYQDIYSEVRDRKLVNHSVKAPKNYLSHFITIDYNCIIHSIFNKNRIRVNSFHHQAVSKLASCFSRSAVSDDGLIEAIECSYKRFFVGVQWHPECLTEEYKSHFRLFERFVNT